MITQKDLAAVVDQQRKVKEAEAHPAVQLYRSQQDALKIMETGLRARIGAGEEWETGKHVLLVKRSTSVAYEKVLNLFRSAAPFMRLLGREPELAEVIRQVDDRDLAAPFVTPRLAVEVVA